jgi:Mn-dependent DtxR family transcriptional regulator
MIFERHEILTRVLITLGVPAEIASEDACRIEHVISQESFDAIKEHLTKHL